MAFPSGHSGREAASAVEPEAAGADGPRADVDPEALATRIVAAGNLPRHVAIIMDGNGRWAKKQGLARLHGHRAGRRPVRAVVEAGVRLGLELVTLYTFSTENWDRPRAEVRALMRFLEETLLAERDELNANNVRLTAIGRLDDLPAGVRAALDETIAFLSSNDGLVINLALSYSGRSELVDATRALCTRVAEGALQPSDVDERMLADALYTRDLPDPDLLIRTSGEKRISNFLLWQLAYAEIHITDVLWPDFDEVDFYEALIDYQSRDRRFGRID